LLLPHLGIERTPLILRGDGARIVKRLVDTRLESEADAIAIFTSNPARLAADWITLPACWMSDPGIRIQPRA
jgi:hypothetical protein